MNKPFSNEIFPYEKIIYFALVCFMVLQMISLCIVQILHLNFYAQTYVINIFFLIFTCILLLTILSLKKEYPLHLTDLCLGIMVIMAVVATFLAIDRQVAIDGAFNRYEGIYSLLCYYTAFLCASLLKETIYRKNIVLLFGAISVFVTIIGILAGHGLLNFLSHTWEFIASIPFGNPNFYGSFVAMSAGLSIGLFLYAPKNGLKRFGLLLFLLSAAAIFCCDSSSPILGTIMAFLLVFVLELVLIVKKRTTRTMFFTSMKKLVLCVILFIGILFLINVTRDNSVYEEIKRGVTGVSEMNQTAANVFSGRLVIWERAFAILPKYWIFGGGVDNFYEIIMDSSLPPFYEVVDKAHNEYIQILLTQGVIAFFSYLNLYLILFIHGVRKWLENSSRNWLEVSLTLLFFSYVTQAFFNISTIQVAPYFWILAGLLGRESEVERA